MRKFIYREYDTTDEDFTEDMLMQDNQLAIAQLGAGEQQSIKQLAIAA